MVRSFATGEGADAPYAAGMVVNRLRLDNLIEQDGAVRAGKLRAALSTLFGRELSDADYLFLTRLLQDGGFRAPGGRGRRITRLKVEKL